MSEAGSTRRRRAAIGALLIGALALAWLLSPIVHDREEARRSSGRSTATATIERRTLIERESVEGTLRYSAGRTIVNRLDTGSGGSSGGGEGPSGGDETAGGMATSNGSPEGRSSGTGGTRFASAATETPPAADDDSQPKPGNKQDPNADDKQDPDPDDKPDPNSRNQQDSNAEGRQDKQDRNEGDGQDPRPDDDGGGAQSGGDGGGARGSGTVTWLARPGSLLERGGTLYKLDDKPVVLMNGSTPAYRRMAVGMADGPDVRQLEANLVALGYGAGITVDEQFSVATADAVKRWQASLGLSQTGAVELGRVTFLSGARRVGTRKTTVGSVVGSGTEILDTTSTRRVVKVELDVSKQSLVRKGDGVVVTLPDGTTVKGRVATIGRVARAKAGEDGGGGESGAGSDSGSGDLVIDMAVVLRSERGTARLDEAPVTVEIAQETKRNALSVPVAALLAQAGGGYAVEVVDRGRRRAVPVKTGLFAGGYVAISGSDIEEGARVAVPEL